MSASLNASTVYLTDSRPPSSMGYERGDPWIANSDSCLVSSKSRTSSLTETSVQNASCDTINDVFSFQRNSKQTDRSLCSITEALQTEKEFMDYVMSFPLDEHNVQSICCRESKKSSVENSPKVGLDHLDNLCKLMEQLSDLKEANVKLRKKVQYLEDLKTLHEIHREMTNAPTICNSGASDDEHEDPRKISEKAEQGLDSRDFGSKLHRSKTTTIVDSRTDQRRDVTHCSRIDVKGKARERSKSVGHPGHSKCKKRPSRWSKVKEVLGIERTNNDEEKSGSSPSTEKSDENNTEQTDHCTIHSKEPCQEESPRPRSIVLFSDSLPKSDEFLSARKKSPKTPWGKMKTMIQSRKDCRPQKSESESTCSKRQPPDKAACDKHEQVERGESRRCARCRKPSFKLQDVPKRHQHEGKHSTGNSETIPTLSGTRKSPSKQLQRRPAVEVHPRTLNSCHPHRPPAMDGGKGHCEPPEKTETASRPRSMAGEDYGDLLQMAERAHQVTSSEIPIPHTAKADIPTDPRTSSPPCSSATVTELLKELQRNLSEDFNKKLEEWHRFRGEGCNKPANLEVERKESFGRFRKFSKPEKKVYPNEKNKTQLNAQKKNLNWLDKELPKIEREILRLSKEKQKFEKRAFHLRRLKEALKEAQNRKEVLIKTSAGEFRFEGISNAFTKKLYEWETRKGVRPELSTIALLDESLKPQEDQAPIVECLSIDRLSVNMAPDQADRLSYQKASSEPDLSALSTAKRKDSNGVLTSLRSKSGDTLLGANMENDLSHSTTEIAQQNAKSETKESEASTFADRDDSYYSLLEENIFLLDQLKDKEETCCRLQSELDRLDEKFDKTNKDHQEELENSRRKLWEIHMSRPRDLQGSLQLISELKTRIEELETCSDKLKCDREKLEESFKYHSEQQRRLADDLLKRIRELQQSGHSGAVGRAGCKKRQEKLLSCDAGHIDRIHELSTKLLQQARDMQIALAERTRQVCHLRWELLHRDMSAVLLQAALHRVTCQGPQAALIPTWNMKRIKFKELKAWSIDTTTRRQSENTIAEDWLQERLKQLSISPCSEWTSVQFNPNDLLHTVHELKKETLHVSSGCTDAETSVKERQKTTSVSAESETVDSERYCDSGSAFNSRSSSLSSGPGDRLRYSHSDTRLYERSRSLSMHRNSSSSMSCVSGFDASESSSLHDSDKIHQHFMKRGTLSFSRKKKNRWPSRDNVSSSFSSHSSGLDEDHVWIPDRDEAVGNDESAIRRLKYESFREVDEDDIAAAGHSGVVDKIATTTNPRCNAPTYSLLKTLISHPSYSKVVHNSAPDSAESAHERDALETFKHNDMWIGSHGELSKEPPCSSFSTDRSKADIDSYNSSTYTSAESLDMCNYVTHREQQLFLDIRNLAISCGRDTKENTSADLPQDELTKESSWRSQTPDADVSGKASNIAHIKYKGTKGFGRTSRTDFKKYEEDDKD